MQILYSRCCGIVVVRGDERTGMLYNIKRVPDGD